MTQAPEEGDETDSRPAGSTTDIVALQQAFREAEPRCGSVTVVAVDGGAGAGKSTLAHQLLGGLEGAALLCTDDLLDGWGDQFGFWARLSEQVLYPLSRGRAARYRQYDWTAASFGPPIELPVPAILIVDGGSSIQACGDYLAVGIYLAVPRSQRERRWIERDGPVQPEWLRWLDAEDRYFAAWRPDKRVIVLPRKQPAKTPARLPR
jgi:uridine kinase